MLAPFHLGKRDSGSKNIISINKLTNLFIKVIKNFLLLSPAGLCFPSLPAGCGLTGVSVGMETAAKRLPDQVGQ